MPSRKPVPLLARYRLVIFMIVQKAGDTSSQRGRVQDVAHGAGVVEQLSLQFRRDDAPQHENGGAETTKDMLILLGQGAADSLVRHMNRFLVIVRQPFLVVGEHAEAVFQVAEFANFAGNIRLLHKSGVFGRFRAVLLRREHVALLPIEDRHRSLGRRRIGSAYRPGTTVYGDARLELRGKGCCLSALRPSNRSRFQGLARNQRHRPHMSLVINETAKRGDGYLLFEAIARWNDEGGASRPTAGRLTQLRVDEGPHNSDGLLLHGRDGSEPVTAFIGRRVLDRWVNPIEAAGKAKSLFREQYNALGKRNLAAIQRIAGAKYRRGLASNRQHPFVDVLLADITESGEVLEVSEPTLAASTARPAAVSNLGG
jgi:hypothetical protein